MPFDGGLKKALAPGLTLNDLRSELPVMTHWLGPSMVQSPPKPAGAGFTLPVNTVPSVRSTVVLLTGSAKISPKRLAWLAVKLTTVSVVGSRTRNNALLPLTVAPLLTL